MSVYSYSVTPSPLGGIATDFDCFFLELNFNHYLQLSYPEETDVHLERFRDSFFYPRDLFFSEEHGGLRPLLSIFTRTGGSNDFLEAILSDVLSFAWELEARRSRDLDHKACALIVDVLVRTPYDDHHEIDLLLGELAQESRSTGFWPATESAINSLKRVTASERRRVKIGYALGCSLPIKKRPRQDSSDSETGCTVCLEEFSAGDQLVELPCGHLYHNDCAVRWLQTSHLCPLCRYSIGS